MDPVKEHLIDLIVRNRVATQQYRKWCQQVEELSTRKTCERIAYELHDVTVKLQREFERLYPESNLESLLEAHHRALREEPNAG